MSRGALVEVYVDVYTYREMDTGVDTNKDATPYGFERPLLKFRSFTWRDRFSHPLRS